MAKMLLKTVKLTIDKENYNPIQCKQGDTGRYLLFQILNNGVPFVLSGRTVRASATKRDGTKIFNDLIVVDAVKGMCELQLTSQMLFFVGQLKVELTIYEGKDTVSLIPFTLDIIASIRDDTAVESTNEFSALTIALFKLDEWNSYFEQTSGKIEEKYTVRLNDVELKVLGNAHAINGIENKYEMNNIPKGNCVVTPIDDDGCLGVYTKLKPLFDKYGRKFTSCVVTSKIGNDPLYMTWEQVEELNALGFDIQSHGYIENKRLQDSTNEEIITELTKSKEILISHGIYPHHFVYQQGSYNNYTLENIRRFYMSAVGTKFAAYQDGILPPLKTCTVQRIGLGSWQDYSNDEIKAKIDAAKLTGAWIIFMIHVDAHTNLHSEGNLESIEEILKYCVDTGVIVETYDQAYRRYMNKREEGNISISGKPYWALGGDMKEYTNVEGLKPQLECTPLSFDAKPSEYLKSTCKKYMREISDAEATSSFPLSPVKKGGMLRVECSNRWEYMSREYKVRASNDVYIQYAIDADTWSTFELNGVIQLQEKTNVMLGKPSDYKEGKIYRRECPASTTIIANGFPQDNTGGTLHVERIGPSLVYVKAWFYVAGKTDFYISSGLTNDTWTDWKLK